MYPSLEDEACHEGMYDRKAASDDTLAAPFGQS
jgi:hypothetical protein